MTEILLSALAAQQGSLAALPGWMEGARALGQAFDGFLTPLLVAAGGVFAFFRFVRGRTFRKRLDISVELSIQRAGGLTQEPRPARKTAFAIAVVGATNVGNSAVVRLLIEAFTPASTHDGRKIGRSRLSQGDARSVVYHSGLPVETNLVEVFADAADQAVPQLEDAHAHLPAASPLLPCGPLAGGDPTSTA